MNSNLISLVSLAIFIFITLLWLFLITLKEGNAGIKKIRKKD